MITLNVLGPYFCWLLHFGKVDSNSNDPKIASNIGLVCPCFRVMPKYHHGVRWLSLCVVRALFRPGPLISCKVPFHPYFCSFLDIVRFAKFRFLIAKFSLVPSKMSSFSVLLVTMTFFSFQNCFKNLHSRDYQRDPKV